MTKDEALTRLREIVNGIDSTQSDDDAGWWECSPGDDFGAGKLSELETLITDLFER